MIFVALPSAAFAKASRLFNWRTAESAPASRMNLIPSALACWIFKIACASPSASRIFASFTASAWRIADCLSASACRITDSLWPSAFRIAERFSPSAIRMDSRRSRSAFICFSMASWIADGGIIFFSSTRLTLMPHGSVASSSVERILALMISRDVSVSSNSRSPIILRSVVAVRFSMAMIGFWTP